MRKIQKIAGIAAGSAMALCLATNVQASGAEENMLQELKKMIEQQQAQLDNQAAEIAKLREQLGGTSEELDKKADKEALEALDLDNVVTSRFEQVDVQLYGQLNRGLLWGDNGESSRTLFVDNANSQSRLGLKAKVAATDDLTIGGVIEYGIKSNSTTDVNQLKTNDATSENWNLRHADIYFASKKMGKLSLGHGDSASQGSSEVDLSGTAVASYSDVKQLAGGHLFYTDTTGLSATNIKSVYNNMDGLGRDDRLRYDTPTYNGLTFSVSAISGDAYDAALRYSRQYGDTKVAAAVAFATFGDQSTTIDSQYSGSASILLDCGFNFTVAAGMRDMETSLIDDAKFWYAKAGYQTQLFSPGLTAFAIDYSENEAITANDDVAKTWSVAAVQNVQEWGTEFYLAYRLYDLDRTGVDYDKVGALLGGARVKF